MKDGVGDTDTVFFLSDTAFGTVRLTADSCRLFPIAYCLLPTAYCLLPTAYCLKNHHKISQLSYSTPSMVPLPVMPRPVTLPSTLRLMV